MVDLPEPSIIADLQGCYVVNKPGGLLTQGPPGIDSLELRIKHFIRTRDAKTGKVYLGVPHRLDRPASGVMVFAKNIRASRRLAAQFRERTIAKKYWAIVEGELSPGQGSLVDWMRKLPDEAKSEICDADHPDAQEAKLKFQVREGDAERTWVEIELETGRTHQIRLQFSNLGHPILGDELYGSKIKFGPESTDFRKRWIALHARSIEFEHPMTKDRLVFNAEVWEDWRSVGFKIGS